MVKISVFRAVHSDYAVRKLIKSIAIKKSRGTTLLDEENEISSEDEDSDDLQRKIM